MRNRPRRRRGCLFYLVTFVIFPAFLIAALGDILIASKPTPTPTITPTPSMTLTATNTFTPTITLTPSLTLTPTITLTASNTPTLTATATLTPTPNNTELTSTQIANLTGTADQKHLNATGTAAIRNQDATTNAEQKSSDASATAYQRSIDATVTANMITAAADDRQSTKTFIAGYKPISDGELGTYPDKHIGEDIVTHGRVIKIDQSGSTTVVQVLIGSGDLIYVELDPTNSLDSIYKGDYVTVYGTVTGTISGVNLLNVPVTQTELNVAVITKP